MQQTFQASGVSAAPCRRQQRETNPPIDQRDGGAMKNSSKQTDGNDDYRARSNGCGAQIASSIGEATER
jgi:hypothetical protein